jgi:hypothetical protein
MRTHIRVGEELTGDPNFSFRNITEQDVDNALNNVAIMVITEGAMRMAEPLSTTTPARTMEAAPAAPQASLAERANQIQSVLSPRTQRSVTTAVAEVTNASGKVERIVASSEGTLRPAQRNALLPGETAVKGQAGTHAEVTAINAAQQNGQTVNAVAASRGICSGCSQSIQDAGAVSASPLKEKKP